MARVRCALNVSSVLIHSFIHSQMLSKGVVNATTTQPPVQSASLPWCGVCGVEFNLFLRRYQCQLCGKTLCYKCGPKQVLEGISQTAVRACTACVNQHEDGREILATISKAPEWTNSSLFNIRSLESSLAEEQEALEAEEEEDGFFRISAPSINRSTTRDYLRSSVAYFTSRELETVQKWFQNAALNAKGQMGWPQFTRTLVAMGYGDNPEAHALFEKHYKQFDRDSDGAFIIDSLTGTALRAFFALHPLTSTHIYFTPASVLMKILFMMWRCLHTAVTNKQSTTHRLSKLDGVP